MSEYPDLIFHRKLRRRYSGHKTCYSVRTREGAELGDVCSLYTGGWVTVSADGERAGYATRYEAGYSLYPDQGRASP